MLPDGTVTRLIGRLKGGDPDTAQPLWDIYFQRMVRLARARLRIRRARAQLRQTAVRIADEEDVALSAFDSFYRRARSGQFPRLRDRNDLWRLLFVLTVRKAIDLARQQECKARG